MLERVRRGRGRAEAVDADAQAVEHGVTFPPEAGTGFNADTQDLFRADIGQDTVAIGGALFVEQFGAGHGNHVRPDIALFQRLCAGECQLHFGAGRDQDHAAFRLRFLHPVGTARALVFLHVFGAELFQPLAREREDAGALFLLQRDFPAFRRLDRIGGPHDEQVGNRPQALQVLDRLVRRAVFPQPDRIMRHHIDDARLL